ncbi:MAG: hypothetical protein PHH54_00850 [Candidatus Nanoarchaeia archaeon]|nr:hypothetical protein [Candidatus Nanoarchaeia archaeon]MDD5740511.1 hypothetical protein [Candidatus Nanoarchaeia archaeon]
MENKIEARKKFIYEQVGEEAIKLLKESGLNIDNAVTNILREQEEQREKLEAQAEFGTVEDIMTSELVYKSKSTEDVFGKEYSRRLYLIGLDDNQIKGLHQVESLILSTGSMSEERKQPWVRRYFIMPDSTPEKMPKVGEMTLSELILITDDANSAFWRDHHVLSGEAWQALCIAACCAQYTEARYAYGFNARTEKLGWSKAQSGAYTKNECLLTERLKWGHHENPAWTPETTNLEQFKR